MVHEIATGSSLGSIVADYPLTARIFENLGIDYCCGGQRSLQQAARDNQLDPVTLMTVLQATTSLSQPGLTTHADAASALATGPLVDHIVAVHHAYIREHLPRLFQLSAKVAAAHGDKDVRLIEFQTILSQLGATLMDHLTEEEQDLFPALTRADGSAALDPRLVKTLVADHEAVGATMTRLKALVDDYAIPEWACPTYRTLIQAFQEFEFDLHTHIHLENNVLFPRLSA